MLPGTDLDFIFLMENDEQGCWFQQDGAMVHTADSTIQMLGRFCGGYIIS
jgi:hypothetical protein